MVSKDAKGGRLPEVIDRGQPAVFLCHWPGLYCNGGEEGWKIFQGVVERLNAGMSDRITWMKMSEIARYWAAKELTEIQRDDSGEVIFDAPVAAPDFTLSIDAGTAELATLRLKPKQGNPIELEGRGGAAPLAKKFVETARKRDQRALRSAPGKQQAEVRRKLSVPTKRLRTAGILYPCAET